MTKSILLVAGIFSPGKIDKLVCLQYCRPSRTSKRRFTLHDYGIRCWLLGHQCIKNLLLRPIHLDKLQAKSAIFRPSHGSELTERRQMNFPKPVLRSTWNAVSGRVWDERDIGSTYLRRIRLQSLIWGMRQHFPVIAFLYHFSTASPSKEWPV